MQTCNKGKFNKSVLVLISFIIPIFLLYISRYIFRFYYQTNDDYAMMAITSGEITGVPDGHLIFIKYVLGNFISYLYSTIPNFSWYPIIMYSIVGISLIAIIYKILTSVNKKKHIILGASIFIYLYFVIFLKIIVLIQFTIVSGIAFIAAYVWYFFQKEKRNRIEVFIDIMICSFLLLLSYCIRAKIFLSLLPFFILTIIYRIIVIKKNEWIRNIVFIGLMTLSITGIMLIESAAYNTPEYKNYLKFNHLRAQIYDISGFPSWTVDNQDRLFYPNNISKPIYDCLNRYCLEIDDRVDSNFLKNTIAYNKMVNKRSFIWYVNTIPDSLRAYSSTNYLFKLSLITVLLFTVALILNLIKKEYKNVYLLLSSLMLVVIESIYLVLYGRINERAIISLLLIIFILSFILLWKKIQVINLPAKKAEMFILANFVFYALFICVFTYSTVTTCIESKDANSNKSKYISYSHTHPDNVYFYSTSSFSSASYEVAFRLPVSQRNYISDGGWMTKSPQKELSMQLNGITNMREGLLQDNVYYICRTTPDYLVDYYNDEGIKVQAILVDELPSKIAGVYKFIQE